MTAAWPGSVNQNALMGTYSEKPDQNVASFDPGVGQPFLRRRMAIATDVLTFDQVLTKTEYAAFLAFYRSTLADGALPFTRNRPRTGNSETFVFTDAPHMRDVGHEFYQVTLSMRNSP